MVFQSARNGVQAVSCKAVILATGGFAGLYGKSDNSSENDGAALAAAMRAGAALRDSEFVFFHPFVSNGACVPTDALTGASVSGKNGERLRAIEHLLKTQAIHERLSEAALGVFRVGGAAVASGRASFEAEPAAHSTLGGIAIRPDTSTSIRGLFACGEAAGGLHSADRVGGAGLSWALVSGRIATEAALSYSAEAEAAGSISAPTLRAGSQKEYFTVLSGVRAALDSGCSVEKDGRGMREALGRVNAVRRSTGESAWGLRASLACEVAEALLLSSMARRESRGCFHRADFPRENAAFKGSFFAYRKNNKLSIRFKRSGA